MRQRGNPVAAAASAGVPQRRMGLQVDRRIPGLAWRLEPPSAVVEKADTEATLFGLEENAFVSASHRERQDLQFAGVEVREGSVIWAYAHVVVRGVHVIVSVTGSIRRLSGE